MNVMNARAPAGSKKSESEEVPITTLSVETIVFRRDAGEQRHRRLPEPEAERNENRSDDSSHDCEHAFFRIDRLEGERVGGKQVDDDRGEQDDRTGFINEAQRPILV